MPILITRQTQTRLKSVLPPPNSKQRKQKMILKKPFLIFLSLLVSCGCNELDLKLVDKVKEICVNDERFGTCQCFKYNFETMKRTSKPIDMSEEFVTIEGEEVPYCHGMYMANWNSAYPTLMKIKKWNESIK